MRVQFEKWHGTGNDFVLIDDRQGVFPPDDNSVVRRICDRHYGAGSDGLILLRQPVVEGTDFHMEFHNPDGSRSFCGNGSRCAFAFWSKLNKGVEQARFTAIDGVHEGRWQEEGVSISLPKVDEVVNDPGMPENHFIHTGSPHLLVWVDEVESVDILHDAPPRRRSDMHGAGGTNVNYVQPYAEGIRMRTYERGVEAETLSCGSGVVAAALSAISKGNLAAPVAVHTRGGRLSVEADRSETGGFQNIRLIGPATYVYHGVMEV